MLSLCSLCSHGNRNKCYKNIHTYWFTCPLCAAYLAMVTETSVTGIYIPIVHMPSLCSLCSHGNRIKCNRNIHTYWFTCPLCAAYVAMVTETSVTGIYIPIVHMPSLCSLCSHGNRIKCNRNIHTYWFTCSLCAAYVAMVTETSVAAISRVETLSSLMYTVVIHTMAVC